MGSWGASSGQTDSSSPLPAASQGHWCCSLEEETGDTVPEHQEAAGGFLEQPLCADSEMGVHAGVFLPVPNWVVSSGSVSIRRVSVSSGHLSPNPNGLLAASTPTIWPATGCSWSRRDAYPTVSLLISRLQLGC